MSLALATFVKTPGLSPIKTRLAQEVGKERALSFYNEGVARTKSLGDELCERFSENLTCYWAVAEAAGLSHPLWHDWDRVLQYENDNSYPVEINKEGIDKNLGIKFVKSSKRTLGHRLSHVYSKLKKQHEVVGLYGADSPLVSADLLFEGLKSVRSRQYDVVAGPTEDGGFYFFASSKPIPEDIWMSVAYSTNKTWLELKIALVKKLNSRIFELPTQFDVDRRRDLERYEASKF